MLIQFNFKTVYLSEQKPVLYVNYINVQNANLKTVEKKVIWKKKLLHKLYQFDKLCFQFKAIRWMLNINKPAMIVLNLPVQAPAGDQRKMTKILENSTSYNKYNSTAIENRR